MTREAIEPTEMELRVAKALEPAFFAEHEQVYEPRYYRELQDVALGQARAVIRAMRTPTHEMAVAAVNATHVEESYSVFNRIYKAMIDAASPTAKLQVGTTEEAGQSAEVLNQHLSGKP